MFPVFLPARLFSEAFTWIDDKINGNTRYGGYFQPGYMTGQTGPGTLTPYNSVNTINYGEPGYIHQKEFVDKNMMGKGYSIGADNGMYDVTGGFQIYLKAPAKKAKSMSEMLFSVNNKYRFIPGAPIPQEYRNPEFVNTMMKRWFKKALLPSNGVRVDNLGKVDAFVDPEKSGGLLDGGSTMYLHEQLAFTSLEQLFQILGHELVHVSQIAELKGLPFSTYLDKNFRDMMDHYAYEFSYRLGGDKRTPFVSAYKEYHNRMNYTSFTWTKERYWGFYRF